MAKKEAVTCPMCGEPAEKMTRDGKTFILCESEDRIYEMTATGAKARQRGRLDDIERRLAALEGRPEPKPETQTKDKDDTDGEDNDDGPAIEIVFGGDEDEEDDETEDDETEDE
ncbi:MAG: hypothetical protein PHR30_18720 [Gallionellaceae bacterium]|nr:hypothetical protein [Gallionellaceae bacterium]